MRSVILKAGTPHLMLAALVGVAFPGTAGAQVNLSFATNTPPSNIRGVAEMLFIEELESRSNGQITVEPFWGGSLIQGDETLQSVRDGVVDMGFININYYPNELLLNSAFNLLVEGPTEYENIRWTFDSVYEQVEELQDEFSSFNQRVVFTYGVTPYAGAFTSEVNSFEDFAGKRVRAASQWYLNLLQGLNAVPVSMAWPDLYQALETGAIDGVFTNVDGLNRSNLDEAAPNLFVARDLWLAIPFIITMNEDVWNGLGEEMQQVVVDASDAAKDRYAERYHEILEEIYASQAAAGYRIVEATPEDIETFVNLPQVEENRQQWVTQAEAQGAADAARILQEITDIVAEAMQR